MNKIYQTFQSPYSLHKPPYYFTLPFPQWVCSQISKNIFFLVGSSCAETSVFEIKGWFQLLSTKNGWSLPLFLISITLDIFQPFHDDDDKLFLRYGWPTKGAWTFVRDPHHHDPELAPVLSGPHLSTSEEWKARGDREICWYDLHGESNLGRPHGSTMVYPLCYKFCFYVCFLSFFR